MRDTVRAAVVEERHDGLLEQLVELDSVPGVLLVLVTVRLAVDRPAVRPVVGLGPLASSGGRGKLIQTSQPPTIGRATERS